MNKDTSKEGFVLATSLIISLAIGIVAISLLRLTLQEFRLSMRSAAYTKALHAAESGAAQACNEFCKEISGDSSAWTGWSSSGTSRTFALSLTNPAGDILSSFNVTASPVPPGTSSVTNEYIFTAEGTAELAGEPIVRTIRIAVQRNSDDSPYFKYGILSNAELHMAGSVAADSFDSTDPTKSTNGQYDPAKAGKNATIATLSSATPAITAVGGANLNGISALSVGEGGTVDIKPWIPFAGDITHDAAQDIKDVKVPFSLPATDSIDTSPWPQRHQSITVNGTKDISLKKLKVASDGTLTIIGSGKLRIYVDDKMSVTGSGQIRLSPRPPTADLKVEFYVNDDVNIAGSGVLNNTRRAASCAIWATENCPKIAVSGNAGYIGTIYAPYSEVNLNGSSFAAGAFLGGEINFSGNTRYYIDESLIGKSAASGIDFTKPYTLKAWTEL